MGSRTGHVTGSHWASNRRRIWARNRGVSDPLYTGVGPCLAPERGVAHAPIPLPTSSAVAVGAAQHAAPALGFDRAYLVDGERLHHAAASDRDRRSAPRCASSGSPRGGAETPLAS